MSSLVIAIFLLSIGASFVQRTTVFGRKGEAIVDANIKALAIGRQAQR